MIMWDSFELDYNKETEKSKRKLRDAWEKFYTPMQLSQVKFRIKVNSRLRKGKFPIINNNL